MFWLPVGILLALLLVAPVRQWGWWIGAAGAAELTASWLWWDNSLLAALAYFSANAIEAAVGAHLLLRVIRQRNFLQRPSDTTIFVVICGLLAPVISATIIASIDTVSGKNPDFAIWPHVWLGDASGILVATPLTLLAIETWRDRSRVGLQTILEVSALGISLVTIGVAAFHGDLPTPYLTLPLLLWAGFRFEMRGALASLGLLVAISPVFSLVLGSRFADPSSREAEVVGLQIFFAVAAVSALFAGVLAHQNALARRALRRSNDLLEARVADRTARLSAALRAGRLGVLELSLPDGTARLDAAASRLWNLTVRKTSLATLLTKVHPADRSTLSESLLKVGEGRDSSRIEIQCRIGEIEPRWVVIDVDRQFHAGRAVTLIGTIQDVSERVEALRRQRLLVDELSHRVKNTLSVVQAIAMQTLRGPGERDARDAFILRITALARGHDLLAREGWDAASLDQLVAEAIVPFGGSERFELQPAATEVKLPAQQALAIALALHELSTNAAKYGALSQPAGRVAIVWGLSKDRSILRLTWTERGGPPVAAPATAGFGSLLLKRVVPQDLNGMVKLVYREEGVECSIEAPLQLQLQSGFDATGKLN